MARVTNTELERIAEAIYVQNIYQVEQEHGPEAARWFPEQAFTWANNFLVERDRQRAAELEEAQ